MPVLFETNFDISFNLLFSNIKFCEFFIYISCELYPFCTYDRSDERRAIDAMFFQSRKRLCLHALNAMSALLRGDGFDSASHSSLSSTAGVASPTSSSLSSSSSPAFSASLSSTMASSVHGSQTIGAATAVAMAVLNGADPQQQQLIAPASTAGANAQSQSQQPLKSIHLQRSVYPWLCDIVCSADPVRPKDQYQSSSYFNFFAFHSCSDFRFL